MDKRTDRLKTLSLTARHKYRNAPEGVEKCPRLSSPRWCWCPCNPKTYLQPFCS